MEPDVDLSSFALCFLFDSGNVLGILGHLGYIIRATDVSAGSGVSGRLGMVVRSIVFQGVYLFPPPPSRPQ